MKKRFNFKIAFWILFLLTILQTVFLISLVKPRPQPRKATKKVVVPTKGRIAIVIDDFGYNLNNLATLKSIKQPLTVSILPNLAYSKAVAESLHQSGFEVILHLPLEPQERYRLEEDTILTSMDKEAITEIIDEALSSVRFARGVSNHMGSKATEDEKTMDIILRELKKRRLYFLDSLVSGKSVAGRLAKGIGLTFARRDIFLDNQQDAEYIKQQFNQLKTKAKNSGWAIGICHDRKLTIEVLKELILQSKREGFKFVFVSDLAS